MLEERLHLFSWLISATSGKNYYRGNTFINLDIRMIVSFVSPVLMFEPNRKLFVSISSLAKNS